MEIVYFSLGSNQGDREYNIRQAISLMDKAFGTPCSRLSSIIETQSWGFDGPAFLNCAAMYELDGISPEETLLAIKDIEKALGRTGMPEYDDGGRRIYRDRPIDIDILYFGDRKIDTPTLRIPHPLIGKRDFVKIPLREICSHDEDK